MKLRQFVSILGVVALLAVIYSPSTIEITASPGGDGGTGPFDTSSSGTSMLIAYLHQAGYNLTIANDTSEAQNLLDSAQSGHERLVYLLIGADTALDSTEVKSIETGFNDGQVSALVAEGNTTNDALIGTVFGVTASGYPIVDPTSTFADKEVFTVDFTLGSINTLGVIDIASPLTRLSGTPLVPAATSSALSYDTKDATPGSRTVVAAGIDPAGARAIVLSDSGPFTNFLFNYTDGAVSEKAFVGAMLSYVDPSKSIPILLDASHYLPPKPPKVSAGLPVGPLVAYTIEQYLSGLNGYYASFPSEISSFFAGFGIDISPGLASALVALVLLFSIYGAVTRWFAPEKRGKDDQALPAVEQTVVAQSAAREEFIAASRSKGSYVATLSQLYEVLDSLVTQEFGRGLESVDVSALAARVGADEAARAKRLFLKLSKIHDYSTGSKKHLLPPVFRWRALTSSLTDEAEAFLNRLGMTIAGDEGRPAQAEKVEYLMKARVRPS